MTLPPRALAIVDGEHYPSVVRAAFAELPYDVVAAVRVGGTEKLRGEEDYGVPLLADLETAIDSHLPDVVIDLSDEPVLDPVARFALASRVLARAVPYVGADFRLDPPERLPYDLPSLAVVGTGKRVGKTAVTGHVARLIATERRVVVVAMGRGGPPEPEVVTVRPTVADLVRLSRSGRHAASDHLETATLVGVETIGCRRCGGGLAGDVFVSNVAAGAELASRLAPALTIFDGSGAALPPIDADRTIVVVGALQAPAVVAGYLNTYRLLMADLVIVTMAERGSSWSAVRDVAQAVVRPGVEVVATVLRPRPLVDVHGKSVAFFCTAPSAAHRLLAEHLETAHGADVVLVSGSLADRNALRAELPGVDAEVYLVELKAAAIDVVAELALGRGADVVLAANDLVPVDGSPLDETLLGMARIG